MHPPASLRRALVAPAAIVALAACAMPSLASADEPAPAPPTARDVCLLTKAGVQASARYQALSASRRAAADRYATDLCANADAIVASLTPEGKAALLVRYDDAVNGAVPQGWLTADQAAALTGMAALI